MTTTTAAPDPDLAPEPEDEKVTLGSIFRDYVVKVRSGDVGSLPAVLGLIVLRIREPQLERPYRTWITTPIIFCCVSLFLLSRAVISEPLQTLIVVAFIITGVPVYYWRIHQRDGRIDLPNWKFWKRSR